MKRIVVLYYSLWLGFHCWRALHWSSLLPRIKMMLATEAIILLPVACSFVGESAGSGYHLLIPGSPSLRGNGCCCAHLPCIRRP